MFIIEASAAFFFYFGDHHVKARGLFFLGTDPAYGSLCYSICA